MGLDLSFLSLVVAVVLFVGIAVLYLSAATRTSERRREERTTKHISRQPWDAAGGRANR
jgi:hypothetical protein